MVKALGFMVRVKFRVRIRTSLNTFGEVSFFAVWMTLDDPNLAKTSAE